MNSADARHLYTREYFLHQVDGYREFADFRGEASQLFERHRRNLDLIALRPAHRFLDVGCGRGELVLHHARTGGDATGVDFSADAIELARQKARELGLSCTLLNASFDQVPTERAFDRILASEFIEHISPAEGRAFFKLARRLLQPDGRLVVYTYPNTLQRRIGYPLQRALVRLATGERLPAVQPDATSEHYRLYHLNEQSYGSLRRTARAAGFRQVRVFYDVSSPPPRTRLGVLARAVAHRGPLRHLFLNHLVCLAEP